jgi:hypothetical protein
LAGGDFLQDGGVHPEAGQDQQAVGLRDFLHVAVEHEPGNYRAGIAQLAEEADVLLEWAADVFKGGEPVDLPTLVRLGDVLDVNRADGLERTDGLGQSVDVQVVPLAERSRLRPAQGRGHVLVMAGHRR